MLKYELPSGHTVTINNDLNGKEFLKICEQLDVIKKMESNVEMMEANFQILEVLGCEREIIEKLPIKEIMFLIKNVNELMVGDMGKFEESVKVTEV